MFNAWTMDYIELKIVKAETSLCQAVSCISTVQDPFQLVVIYSDRGTCAFEIGSKPQHRSDFLETFALYCVACFLGWVREQDQ